MTPLARYISEMIAQNGPIPLDRYMALCLSHPAHGYYMRAEPFGTAGDFITAPEISQMFGELLGLWTADVWNEMGQPSRLSLIEIGPGRGTLMADALRALRVVPGLLPALDVHLVETSPRLAAHQRAALADSPAPVSWHANLDSVPAGPSVILANELFDALPIRQFVKMPHGWHERMIGLEGDRLIFGLLPDPTPEPPIAPSLLDADDGNLAESCASGRALIATIATRLASQGGAALLIDYGYGTSTCGDSLQAVSQHRYVDPLETPGEADLTAHVDFAMLAGTAREAGARIAGLLPQGELLNALGLAARAQRLMAARPDLADDIDTARRRLVDMTPTGMGALFKALALATPGLKLPVFDI